MGSDAKQVRLSLRARWTVVLLGTVLAPMAVFALAGTSIQKQGLENAERQLEVSILAHVAETVAGTLRDATAATHRVGQILTEARITDDDARLRLSEDALARAEALSSVSIYAPDGKLLDTIARKDAPKGSPPPETLPSDAIAAAQKDNAGTWLSPQYEHGAPTGILRYLEPVVRDGERRAWVLGTLGPGLGEHLQGISRDRFAGRPDGVILVDNDVRVFAGPTEGPLSVGTKIGGTDVFKNLRLPENPFAQPFGSATEFSAADGEAMVGTVQSIPSLKFAVAVRREEREVYAALHRSRRLLLATALALVVLALGVGTWLAARTTRPVAELIELAKAYARREFTKRSPVRTGDELEQLGASMAEMADQIGAGEKEILRRAAVEADLSRFLPSEVAKSIADGSRKLALGGERRTVSVLFADVVSFTTFAEGAPPEKVVAFLNELFTVLTEVVFRHGGTIDKFIGDCVMAIFGAPNEQADHAARALACAEDMHRFVEASAPAWKAKFGVECKLGVGVNAGEALVGNLGSDTRMEYTAIGDVVNVAARLEGLARPGQTLVTEEIAKAVGDDFTLSPLGEHPLRGKKQAVQILELA